MTSDINNPLHLSSNTSMGLQH